MGIGFIPSLIVPYRSTDGVKVIAGEPYMALEAEEERWVYAPDGQYYYFNIETGEIRLFKDTEVTSG